MRVRAFCAVAAGVTVAVLALGDLYRWQKSGIPLREAYDICGTSMRWRDLGIAFQNEESEHECYGAGDRFRGIDSFFHVALFAKKPFFISLSEKADFTRMLAPREFYWNVTDVPALEDEGLIGAVPTYNEKIFQYIRNGMRKAQILRGRPETAAVWKRQASQGSWNTILWFDRLVTKAKSHWGEAMPASVADILDSVIMMRPDNRFGCVWHTLFRVAPDLQVLVAEAILEVAQKSQLLRPATTFRAVFNRSGLRNFFESRYGNLSMPRASMKDAIEAIFPGAVIASEIPTYVSVHLRRGVGTLWKEGGDSVNNTEHRVSINMLHETIDCALDYSGRNDTRIIFASDSVEAKVGAIARSDKVITLRITEVPGHIEWTDDVESEILKALTEIIVLSLSDLFMGCRSGFGRTA
eukprot:Polyplicarium_translucidae@DN3067_c0_g2_i2.p1